MNAPTTRRFRLMTSDDLTAERLALIHEMLRTYDGGDATLRSYAGRVQAGGALTNVEVLRYIVNIERTPVAAPRPAASTPTIKDGTYTVVNPRTGGYRTIRITSDTDWMTNRPAPGTRIAQYLYGPDNSTSFRGFAFVSQDGTAKVWRSSQASVEIVAALNWLLVHGAGKEGELGKAYATISGRCCFCGRKLTTPGSTHYGYGPDCAEKQGMPWDGNPRRSRNLVEEAEEVASCAADRIGFQRVATNPVTIVNADGSETTTAKSALRTYRDLFGED